MVRKLRITLSGGHAQRQIQVELDAERSNLGGFCVRERTGESWTLRPRRSGASGPLCVWFSRCETGAALVRDESVSTNPELCQGFQIALVSA
jgi:hypothetical protein